MSIVKKIGVGLSLGLTLTVSTANAGSLNGKFNCLYKAMDIEFLLELNNKNIYAQEIEFVGNEKGNYSIDGKLITFTPSENSRDGKQLKVNGSYKRNIISLTDSELVMTNINDDDKIFCKK